MSTCFAFGTFSAATLFAATTAHADETAPLLVCESTSAARATFGATGTSTYACGSASVGREIDVVDVRVGLFSADPTPTR
jgi:hypothetical protein